MLRKSSTTLFFATWLFPCATLVATSAVAGSAHAQTISPRVHTANVTGGNGYKLSPVSGNSIKKFHVPDVSLQWILDGNGSGRMRIYAVKVTGKNLTGDSVKLWDERVTANAPNENWRTTTVKVPTDWIEWKFKFELDPDSGANSTKWTDAVWFDIINPSASGLAGVPAAADSGDTLAIRVDWATPTHKKESMWAYTASPYQSVIRWLMHPNGNALSYDYVWEVPAGTSSKTVSVTLPVLNYFESDHVNSTLQPASLFDVQLSFGGAAKLSAPLRIVPNACKMTHDPLSGARQPGSKIKVNFDMGCKLASDEVELTLRVKGMREQTQIFSESKAIGTTAQQRRGQFVFTAPEAGDAYDLCYWLQVTGSSIEDGDVLKESTIYNSCTNYHHSEKHWINALKVQAGGTSADPSPSISGKMCPLKRPKSLRYTRHGSYCFPRTAKRIMQRAPRFPRTKATTSSSSPNSLPIKRRTIQKPK